MEDKTNAMRMLDQKKITYTSHIYPHGEEAVDGVTVASLLGQDPAAVFKTLVTRGASKNYYVFVVPVAETLDLKKAARAVGEKSVDMIEVRELLPLTGYVRGGCSPIGMKKQFKTTLDASCEGRGTIYVSAGRIGLQIGLAPADLLKMTRGQIKDITAR